MEEDKYLTVTALTNYIKRKFDADPYLHRVYLVGEISNFRMRMNSHQYFSLKDENAKISAIMFKSAFSKVKFQPEEGMKVIVSGRISLYPGNGSYQIYVDSMQPDGVGALYQAYEQLKAKLAQEGLFSAPKLAIPKYPKKIAIVTSPSGAVIRDIITTVSRRFPIVQLVLFPAVVQGSEAAPSIAAQIKMINSLEGFDTIIIGRGGGSIEDLWPFNEEVVARAIFESHLPVISSVGHETDTTIADLVADMRAATPTAAAELATPVLSDILEELQKNRVRMVVAFKNILNVRRQEVEHLEKSYIFQEPQRLYEGYLQNVDILMERLVNLQTQQITNLKSQFQDINSELTTSNPITKVKLAGQEVEHLKTLTINNTNNLFYKYRTDLKNMIGTLDTLSPLKIMSRGYTYVTKNGKVIKTVDEVKVDDPIQLNFNDGEVDAVVKNIRKKEEE